MKIGSGTKTGLFLVLGVLAGLGFIGLPGILTASIHSSSPAAGSTNATSNTHPPNPITSLSSNTRSIAANTTAAPQSADDVRLTSANASWLIVVLVVPALAISLFASILASRRTRRIRDRINESDSDQ